MRRANWLCFVTTILGVQSGAVFAQTIGGYAAMGASETQGSTYTGSWVPYLVNNRGLDFGGSGNPYNVAVGGATSATLLTQGQHTEVRDLILAGDVDLAYLSIGGNDFGAVATSIATGTLSGAALTNWANGVVNNILTAVDTVLSANPTGMVVSSIPDMTLTPAGRQIGSVPIFLERGLAAVNLVNSILRPAILERDIVYIDFAQAMRDLDAQPPVVGGVTINMVTASTNPTHFFQDNLHPAAVGNGIIANVMMAAANIAYGTSTPLLTDLEILTRAGLAASYAGETSNLDYSRYIIQAPSEEYLLVASTDNSRFIQIDGDQNAQTIAQSPALFAPLDAAHDAAGNRYVIDAAFSRVTRYDDAGQASIFADAGDGILLPTAIEADGQGNFFVANYLSDQIVRIDSSGNATLFSDAARGLESPFGLAAGTGGNLFVAEVDSRRVLTVDSSGNATVLADAADGLATPVALAFGADGFLYVADAALSKVFRIDALGNTTIFADAADGVFFPTGLAFDGDGNLYVANYLSDQIIKLDPSGVGSVFATAADGIDGPFGLDFLSGAGASFALEGGLRIAAVPEAASGLLTALATMLAGAFWLRRRAGWDERHLSA